MSLEKLKREVLAQAERQAQASLESARQQENEITRQAREQAERELGEAEGEAREEARELGAELRAGTALQAKRLDSEAREQTVQGVLGEVREELRRTASGQSAQSRARYEKIFGALARQAIKALGEKDFVVKAAARDKAFAAKYGRFAEAIETDGGIVVASADGSVSVNNTFEALVEEKEEELKQLAFSELFGSHKKEKAKAKTKANVEPAASAKPVWKKQTVKTAKTKKTGKKSGKR